MANCDYCNESFEKLGLHWYYNEDHRTEISKEENKIITGVLMGDGTINRDSGNPRLVVEMTNKDYLSWLDKKLGNLSCGVSLHRTSEQNSKRGVLGNYGGEYKDTYVLKTRRHPEIEKFSTWYELGYKEFPSDITLTSTVLKHWYVCDGHYRDGEYHNSIEIGVENESKNKCKINTYFTERDLPEPTWCDTGNSVKIRFTNSESKEIFNYMGEYVEGFSYKFP